MPSKETGLICTGESVRGILDGRKTQMRRIVKLEYYKSGLFFRKDKYNTVWFGDTFPVERHVPENILKYCPYGVVGDRLYLQEAYRVCNKDMDRKQAVMVHYYSDRSYHSVGLTDAEWALWLKRKKPFAKTSGRFMYKSLARIWLEITGIRVERVQEISEHDAIAEGLKEFFWNDEAAKIPHVAKEITEGKRWWNHVVIKRGRKSSVWDCPRKAFRELWDDINAKRGYGWDKNPWVWVLEFRKVKDGNRN